MTKQKVKEQFAEVMYSTFAIGDIELVPSKNFKDGLGLDSLDRVELVVEIEREFQIVLEDQDIDRAETVEKMIDEIYLKVKED